MATDAIPFYIVARFGTGYTSGLAFTDGQVLPYKDKGTWMVSLAIQVGDDPTAGLVFVSGTKQPEYQPLKTGYVLVIPPEETTAEFQVTQKSKVRSLPFIYLWTILAIER